MGDVSASFSSELGFVTIARFGNTVMILKWMVADFADQAIEYYPQIVTAAADKIAAD